MPAIVTKSYIDLYQYKDIDKNPATFRVSRISGNFGVPGQFDNVLTKDKVDMSSKGFKKVYLSHDYNVTCTPLEQKF